MQATIENSPSEALMSDATNVKEAALKAIQTLPDTASYDDIMYHLYVLNQIHLGMKDIEEGITITHEELTREMATW